MEKAAVIGLTSGCFDLLHVGHLQYLRRCRQLCDFLVVGIDSDEMVRKAKGPGRPIIRFPERLALVEGLRPVGAVIGIESLEDLDRAAEAFHVTKLFKHEGFKQLDHVYGLAHGAELVIVADVPGLLSTTAILDRVDRRPRP